MRVYGKYGCASVVLVALLLFGLGLTTGVIIGAVVGTKAGARVVEEVISSESRVFTSPLAKAQVVESGCSRYSKNLTWIPVEGYSFQKEGTCWVFPTDDTGVCLPEHSAFPITSWVPIELEVTKIENATSFCWNIGGN